MMHAYDSLYLQSAQNNMAVMLDFAVHDLHYALSEFMSMFLSSDIAKKFENGVVSVVAGRSGIELAYDIVFQVEGRLDMIESSFRKDRTPEYWVGWALAYYQWYSGKEFRAILDCVPVDEIRQMYEPYHEMDIRQFVDRMEAYMSRLTQDSNLKKYRMRAGLTQKELAERSEIPLRSIQQYEQRQKNINKAQAEYVLRLAQVLCCAPQKLLE